MKGYKPQQPVAEVSCLSSWCQVRPISRPRLACRPSFASPPLLKLSLSQDVVVSRAIRFYLAYDLWSRNLRPHSRSAVGLHTRLRVRQETYRISHRVDRVRCVLTGTFNEYISFRHNKRRYLLRVTLFSQRYLPHKMCPAPMRDAVAVGSSLLHSHLKDFVNTQRLQL